MPGLTFAMTLANPVLGARAVYYRLSAGTASAPSAPDADLTSYYGADNIADITNMGGGSLIADYFGVTARQFPVASESASGGNTAAGDGTNARNWRVGFQTDASRVAFKLDYSGALEGDYAFIVDGLRVTAPEPPPLTGGFRWLVLDMGPGPHEVIQEGFENKRALGFTVPIGASVTPITVKRALVLGDSFSMAVGASLESFGWAARAGDRLGIKDTWQSGVSGTGYLNTVGSTKYKLSERVTADVQRFGSGDLIIVAMGLNDLALGDVTTEANVCFDAIRVEDASVPVVVLGPWDVAAPSAPQAGFADRKSEIQTAVGVRSGFYFIDLEGVSFTKSDGTHPDDAGHVKLAAFVAEQIDALSIL